MADADGHPAPAEMELGRVLAALADPLRRRIVVLLAAEPEGGERACGSFGLPVTKATRTHHFKVLREAGLIHQTDRGNSRTNRLRRAELEQRFPGLIALIEQEGLPVEA